MLILFFGQFIIDVEMQPCGPSLRKGAIFPLVIYTDLFLVCVVAFLLCTSFVIYHILYVRQGSAGIRHCLNLLPVLQFAVFGVLPLSLIRALVLVHIF